MKRSLKGVRVAVLAADGFEKVELTVPVAVLKAAGAEVEIVSLRHGRIRGVNLHEPAGRVAVDRTVEQAHVADYDVLFVPGGFINPDLLRQSDAARDFVRTFEALRKPIATLCHGPWVLASAGVLRGRVLTSWPGIRDDMVNAGATWLDRPVVRDHNLVSSRGPQDLKPFIEEMISLFAGDPAPPPHPLVASDPQRKRAPRAPLAAMKWLPSPFQRGVAATLAALAFGSWFLARRRRRRASIERRVVHTELMVAEAQAGPLPTWAEPSGADRDRQAGQPQQRPDEG
jgi:protease I